MKQYKLSAVAIAVAALSVFEASAAGFQVTTHSATGVGRANAGEAVIADNASVLARNPAAITRFDSQQLSLGANLVDPSTNVTNISSTFGPIADQKDVTQTTLVPNIYFVQPVNDRLSVGLAAFSNFGTSSEFSDEFNNSAMGFAGLVGGKTKITTYNANASIAYKITDGLSLGLGVNLVRGEGEITRKIGGEQPVDMLTFKGDGWATGLDAGLMYEVNENHRFGLSYRQGIKMNASGEGVAVHELAGPIALSELTLNLPDIAEFSGFHQVSDAFAVHYSVQWTKWSEFEKLTFKSDLGDVDRDYGWQDAYRYAIGGTYTISPKWTARAGIALDNSPIPAEKRVISIPCSDRVWYSAGVSYQISEKGSLDFGLTFISSEKVDVYEPLNEQLAFSAQTQTDALIYGIQYSRSF